MAKQVVSGKVDPAIKQWLDGITDGSRNRTFEEALKVAMETNQSSKEVARAPFTPKKEYNQ